MVNQCQQWGFYSLITTVVAFCAAVSAVEFRLSKAQQLSPAPKGILVLGGGNTRETAAAAFAMQHPNLKIWVSSGLLPPQANEVFLSEGVSLSRVKLDYRATDTVTNFTTLAFTLRSEGINHVYLVTSDFHMRRAKAIAFWVLGSHGIAYTSISVPSTQTQEPIHKVARDVARSWLWLLTGHTGATLNPERKNWKKIGCLWNLENYKEK